MSGVGAAALAFIAPSWHWAVERGGALGGVAALAVTAGMLFSLAGRTDSASDAGGVGDPLGPG